MVTRIYCLLTHTKVDQLVLFDEFNDGVGHSR